MKHFRALLQRQAMDEQFDSLKRVDKQLADQGHLIHVLQAGFLSAIDQESLQEMQQMQIFRLYPISEASHFIHITHKERIQHLLSLIQ
jgi:hypothetical protein